MSLCPSTQSLPFQRLQKPYIAVNQPQALIDSPRNHGLAIKATSARYYGGSVLKTTGLESGDVMNAGYASQGRIDLRTNEDYESLCPYDRLKRPRSYILRCQSQL